MNRKQGRVNYESSYNMLKLLFQLPLMRRAAFWFLPARLFRLFLIFFFFFKNSLFSQHTISGRVTGSEGNGLVGATVTSGKSGKSVITDTLGRFVINVGAGHLIIISHIGYREQRIILGTRFLRAWAMYWQLDLFAMPSVTLDSMIDERGRELWWENGEGRI